MVYDGLVIDVSKIIQKQTVILETMQYILQKMDKSHMTIILW